MKQKLVLFAMLQLVLGGGAAPAMTVDCPPFEEKVQLAQLIFDGTVTHVATRKADLPGGRKRAGNPHTFYTFAMQRVFKGSVAGGGDTVTLRFEGGEVYDAQGKMIDAESVPGLPRFKVGDRAILFVANNGDVMSPLMCMMAEYRIWRLDDLPNNSEEAWIVENPYSQEKEVVFKPENAAVKKRREFAEAITRYNDPESLRHVFGATRIEDIKDSEDTWTPPPGAKPYEPDVYADMLAERIEKELDRQVTTGKFVAPEPVESQDIDKPFYVGGGFGRALDKHGNRLHPDAK